MVLPLILWQDVMCDLQQNDSRRLGRLDTELLQVGIFALVPYLHTWSSVHRR